MSLISVDFMYFDIFSVGNFTKKKIHKNLHGLLFAQIFCCLFKTAAGIMVISMRSTRVKQFLLKIVKFVFCHSKNTTKLYMSGSHNSKVTRQRINRAFHRYCRENLWTPCKDL